MDKDERRAQPAWVCANCGSRFGKHMPKDATWHYGTCHICLEQAVAITEPRDFGYLDMERVRVES